jgi:hypothetical protein
VDYAMVRWLGRWGTRLPIALKFYFNLPSAVKVSSTKIRPPKSIIKAARVHLGMTQPDLAKAAGLSLHTIVIFERSLTVAYDSTWDKIQNALEARGIVFTNGDKPGFYHDKDKVIIPT